MTTETGWLNADVGLIDLHFQGVSHVIAAYLLPTDDGLALIECGPSTTIDALLGGVASLGHDPADIRHILVTHIHLDHAGAAGSLMRRYPDARFYVHEVGAPHMIDPSNLVRSATRIYGEQMETLWGEFVPVPADRLTVVKDGDDLEVGGRALRVLYTPGHASHHVAYHDPRRNAVFTGDVAGIRIPPTSQALPPTPPPDVDIERWHASLNRLREIAPEQLLLTHFGPVDAVSAHLEQLGRNLDEWTEFVRDLAGDGLERDAIVERLAERIQADMGGDASDEVEQRFALNVPYGMAVDGLLRYLRKRGEIPA